MATSSETVALIFPKHSDPVRILLELAEKAVFGEFRPHGENIERQEVNFFSGNSLRFTRYTKKTSWFRYGQDYCITIKPQSHDKFTITVSCKHFDRLGFSSYLFFFLLIHIAVWAIGWVFGIFFNADKKTSREMLDKIIERIDEDAEED